MKEFNGLKVAVTIALSVNWRVIDLEHTLEFHGGTDVHVCKGMGYAVTYLITYIAR